MVLAKKYGIDIIERHKPNIGLGPAMDFMFNKHIKSQYLLYLQDDFEFERPIELDRVLWTMDNHSKINLINFSHYKNVRLTDFTSREIPFFGLKMCSYNGWTFTPGIWRMSKVREKWKAVKVRPEGYFTNQFGTHEQRLDPDYCYEHLGAYHYGGMGEPRYVRHLGTTWRMAEWRREEGGKLHWEFQNLERDRAPWLGKLPKRPINPDIKLTDEGRKYLEEQPEYIKDRYGGK